MANYQRFWDVHLYSGHEFDFADDIAAFANYQLETKGEHKIKGSALILVDAIPSWKVPAAALLRAGGFGLWFDPSAGNPLGIADFWGDLIDQLAAITPPATRIGLVVNTEDNSLNGKCRQKVTIFRATHKQDQDRVFLLTEEGPAIARPEVVDHELVLPQPAPRAKVKAIIEVHATYVIGGGKSKGYFYIRQCRNGRLYASQTDDGKQLFVGHGALEMIESDVAQMGNVLVVGRPLDTTLRNKVISAYLPRSDYLGTMVEFNEVSEKRKSYCTAQTIEWLRAKESKMRINAHGDGEGNIYMGNTKIPAAKLVDWLVANGLTSRGQWRTLSLSICMGARTSWIAAGTAEDLSAPAIGSAVAEVAEALGNAGVHGVKVTGANEIMWGVVELPSHTTVEGGLLPGQTVIKIDLPTGWEKGFDKEKRELAVPPGWSAAST